MARNLFEHTDEFDTDIDVLIDGAYAENLAAGRVVDSDVAEQVGKNALRDALETKSRQEFKPSFYTNPELHAIFPDDPEMAEIFSRTFDAHLQVFLRRGVSVPCNDVKELHQTIDLAKIADAYKDLAKLGAEPMIIMAPNQGVNLDAWKRTYKEVAGNSPLLDRPDFPPLLTGVRANTYWQEFSQPPKDYPVIDGWTMRVMPTNPDFNGTNRTAPLDQEGSMPTISEYLTAQAVRLVQKLDPIAGKATNMPGATGYILLESFGYVTFPVGKYNPNAQSIEIDTVEHEPANAYPEIMRIYMYP